MRTGWMVAMGLFACGGSNTKAPPDSPPPPPIDGAPDADPNALTPDELAAIAQLSPLPAVPADTTNAYADSAAAAALGQMLFFDKSYSGALAVGDDTDPSALGMVGETGKVACASCHTAGAMQMDDQRTSPNNVSLGTDYGTRNALGVVNSSYYTWTNWGGRFDSQWSLPLAVAENGKLMNSTRLAIAHLLWNKYRTEYNAIFPVALDPSLDPAATDASRFPATGKPGQASYDGMAAADKAIVDRIFANYGKAIQAYERELVSGNSRFDQLVAGDRAALSASEIHGLKLFLASGCTKCHSGPDFTDHKFHALVVPQSGTHVPATDLGRYSDLPPLLASAFNTSGAFSDDTATGKLTGLAQDASQQGQFRTRSLRNVAQSAPFMHDGALATLDDVLQFYAQGGGDPGSTGIVKDPLLQPLTLSAQDRADLAAFLGTLTGDPPPAMLLADTSK
ncbi:MAG: cytochrome-c peroxidase [Acidobacteriota bacterium]